MTVTATTVSLIQQPMLGGAKELEAAYKGIGGLAVPHVRAHWEGYLTLPAGANGDMYIANFQYPSTAEYCWRCVEFRLSAVQWGGITDGATALPGSIAVSFNRSPVSTELPQTQWSIYMADAAVYTSRRQSVSNADPQNPHAARIGKFESSDANGTVGYIVYDGPLFNLESEFAFLPSASIVVPVYYEAAVTADMPVHLCLQIRCIGWPQVFRRSGELHLPQLFFSR